MKAKRSLPPTTIGRRFRRSYETSQKKDRDAIDAAYDGWAKAPPARDTVGEYAADWTDRHPRSARTNYDRNSMLRQVLEVRIEGRELGDWPF